MLPDSLRSEQEMQRSMLILSATYDEVLSDGESPTDTEVVINFIEVLSDSVSFTEIEMYQPQDKAFSSQTNLMTLSRGTYFGYFKAIEVDTGTIRIVSW